MEKKKTMFEEIEERRRRDKENRVEALVFFAYLSVIAIVFALVVSAAT